MTIVRELVARLGFQVDKAGFQAAERGVAGIKGALATASGVAGKTQGKLAGAGAAAAALGSNAKKAAAGVDASAGAMGAFAKLAATAGLTHVLKSMVQMASDANETGNVLGEVFGPAGAAQIVNWSEKMGLAMGRSKYDLQAYAGRLGSVIEPMIHNKEKTLEMSEALSGLAVDLGSFYNVADDEALQALRSGLTGEYESMKRLGIVLNDATLADFAHTQGIKKKTTAMSIAEKTELRYGFIMANSTAAQGDAARTGEGYANATKALNALLMELGTDIGMTVIPKLEHLVRTLRDGMAKLKELTAGTHALEATMYALGAGAAALAISLVAPFLPAALAIGGVVLLLDELYNLFTGGHSVIGDWIDEWGGLGTADSLVQQLKEDFRGFLDTMDELPDVQGSWELFAGSIDDVGFAIDRLIDKMLWFISGPARAWNSAMDKLNHVFRLPQTALGKEQSKDFAGGVPDRRTDPNLDQHTFKDGSQPTVIRTQVQMRRREREARIRAEVEARHAARVARRKASVVDAAIAKEDATMSRDRGNEALDAAGVSIATSAPLVAGPGFGRARVSASPSFGAPAPVAAPVMSYVGGPTTITINGGDPRETKRVVTEVLDARDRALMSSLPIQSEG